MWRSLAPARRRFFTALLVLALVVVATAVVVAVVGGEDEAGPAPQDRPGPVLLVPGYGGSTSALEVLAEDLVAGGRDARVVAPVGSGTDDLRDQAAHLAEVVEETIERTGAPSVDLVGYSAGGVVVRYYVAELGGRSTVRRAVTLASPHHGTDLAALASTLGDRACPAACRQLDPGSELLRRLGAGDETPDGPSWVALWTEDDATVVPPTSGTLEGALTFSVQAVCPDLTVSHADVPRTPEVVAMVEQQLGVAAPRLPDASLCRRVSP